MNTAAAGYGREGESVFDSEMRQPPQRPPESERRKEYYVKAEDLAEEIRRYQESKRQSPDGKGVISEELRPDDHEDLHEVLDAPQVLPGTATGTSSSLTPCAGASRTPSTR